MKFKPIVISSGIVATVLASNAFTFKATAKATEKHVRSGKTNFTIKDAVESHKSEYVPSAIAMAGSVAGIVALNSSYLNATAALQASLATAGLGITAIVNGAKSHMSDEQREEFMREVEPTMRKIDKSIAASAKACDDVGIKSTVSNVCGVIMHDTMTGQTFRAYPEDVTMACEVCKKIFADRPTDRVTLSEFLGMCGGERCECGEHFYFCAECIPFVRYERLVSKDGTAHLRMHYAHNPLNEFRVEITHF